VGRISGFKEAVTLPGAVKESAKDISTGKTAEGKTGRPLFESVKDNLASLAYLGDKFAVTYHPLITLLLLYGIVRRKIPFKGNRAAQYLLLVIVIYLLILFRIHMVYDWFARRHILPLTVLALYWAGMSFGSLADGLKRFASGRRGASAIPQGKITAICIIIVLAITLPKALKPQRLDKLPEKRVGIWLRETNEKPPVIITNMTRVSFYARGVDHYPPGYAGIDYLFRYAEENAADYMVFNEEIEDSYPDFFAEAEKRGLELILTEGEEGEEKVLVYRVK
jgi:hypothetical protein